MQCNLTVNRTENSQAGGMRPASLDFSYFVKKSNVICIHKQVLRGQLQGREEPLDVRVGRKQRASRSVVAERGSTGWAGCLPESRERLCSE